MFVSTLKNRFRIVILSMILLLVCIAASVAIGTWHAITHIREETVVDELLSNLYELRYLNSEYFDHPSERVKQQWRVRFNLVESNLATHENLSRDVQDALHNLRQVFERLASVPESSPGIDGSSKRLKNQYGITLSLESQRIIDWAFETSRRTKSSIVSHLLLICTITISLMLAGTLIFIAIMLFTMRHILASIVRLKEGAETIAGGRLGFQVDQAGSDEIATLATAVNRMSLDLMCSYNNLQKRTVQLENEIEERKHAEAEKEKLQSQWSQVQKIEAIGQLAGGVAHDFNNMLSVIMGHVEIAMDKVDSGRPLLADLVEIRLAAERSAALTRQMLAFARKQSIDPKVLDLNETVAGMLKMIKRLISEDVQLLWQPAADLWSLKIDPSQIDQILANLCVNARDAIGGVGLISIETKNVSFDAEYCADHADSVPGDFILLSVSDDGCGMNKDVQQRLFEPFYTTKAVGKGTGLGLATVYGIVKQNNGIINVYSEPGKGTIFRIYLPRYVALDEAPAEILQARELAEPLRRGQETILLVEDEPSLLELNTLLLESQGYRVLPASTPSEAILLAEKRAGDIQLLMTDVVLPEMNGRDLAQRLLSLYPELKCLFTSGYTPDVIAHHGVLEAGVHFIQKPFTRKDLANKVREVLK